MSRALNKTQLATEVLVFGRSGFVGSWIFNDTRISIGRAEESMVRLDDPAVSRKHALLILDGGFYRIKDAGSRTGILVNGKSLLPRQPLESTDDILIGPFRLRVTTCEPEDEGESSIDSLLAATFPSQPTSDAPPAASPVATSAMPDASTPRPVRFAPPARSGAPALVRRSNRASAAPHSAASTAPLASPPKNAAATSVRAPAADLDASATPFLGGSLVGYPEATRLDPQASSGQPAPLSWSPAAPPAALQRSHGREPKQASGTLADSPLHTATLADDVVRFSPAVTAAPPDGRQVLSETNGARGRAAPSREVPDPLAGHFDDAPAYVLGAAGVDPHSPDASPDAADAAVELAFASSSMDDDDEDDEQFVPTFDLRGELSQAAIKARRTPAAAIALEVIHYRGDRILSVSHPNEPGPVRPARASETVGRLEEDGTFSFFPEEVREFVLTEEARTLTTAEALLAKVGTIVKLRPGMSVDITLTAEDKLQIHWAAKAEALPTQAVSLRPSRDGWVSSLGSLGVHVAMVLVLALFLIGEKKPEGVEINAGRFATVDMKELELEPPPKEEPPEPVASDAPPTTEPLPPTPHEHEPAHVRSKVTATPPAEKGARQAAAKSNESAQRILSALGGASSNSASTTISVTNLDAIRVGAGADAFRVSGAVGKAPGDTLRVASNSGGDVATKSAAELGGNNLGRVQGQTSGVVRARVTAAPQSIRGEGRLDRGEIQRVVNAHLFQIQGCYERQLARDSSLSGKISFEWAVDASGSVANVRIGRSSLQSAEAAGCMRAAIQGWKFPAPQGGSVTVTYPFAFSALGG